MVRGVGGAREVGAGLLRLLAWSVAFVGAGFLGRATIVDDGSLSLVWPAAGIGVVWLLSGWGRSHRVDLVALAACTFVVNRVTGAPADLALVFVAANLVQATLFAHLIRRALPDVRGLGGTRPLAQVRDLGRVTAIGAACCLVAALLGSTGLWLVTDLWSPLTLLLWWGRNTVGLVALVTLGLLLLPGLDRLRERGPAGPDRGTLRVVETLGLWFVTGCLYALVFAVGTAQPLAFLLLAPSVWAGIRLSPTTVVIHGVLGGAAAIVFTLNGLGPFIAIESLPERALVSQVFVLMSVVTGLALAFSRSERDAALAALRTAQQETADRAGLLASVLETMHEGIAVVDAAGRVLIRNPAGGALMGLDDETSTHVRSPEEIGLFHPDGRKVSTSELPHHRVLAGEIVQGQELIVRSELVPRGRILELSAQLLDQVSTDGQPLVMVNYRDVTLDRQDRDALASFAGVVAHDLLNPLTIVDGWAEALSDELHEGPLSPATGLAMTERIHGAARHMRDFIGELLSWTVARGQSLALDEVDLSQVSREIAELRLHGETRPVITVSEGMHAWGDEVLLRQLVDNLVGNAIKYVAPGVRPVVDVSGEDTPEGLVVSVTDNGIGIPPDERERVFDTFHRAHAQGYRGTGLGLSICRQIVERHGGSIRVESASTGGSRFVITLPRSSPVETVTTAPVPATEQSAEPDLAVGS